MPCWPSALRCSSGWDLSHRLRLSEVVKRRRHLLAARPYR
jgi:hypothetical protein